MAGKGPVIEVKITADSKGAKKGTDDAAGFFESFGKKTSGIMVGVGAAIGTFAISAGKDLISAAGGWINLAKEAEIFDKKANTVFGDSAADIKKWADGVNESFGLSDEAVVGMAASLGDLLVPLGFSREAAAGMSKTMIDLSGALSAWSGGTIDAAQVSDIMTKAMLGETDGLKALGISISAEEVARKAATMAAEGQTFATEEQARAAATQALILEKSTDAQKAWTDGTMDSVKEQNKATAAWKDAKVALGEQLLPIVQKATAWFVNSFVPAAQEVVAEFKERWPAIKETVQDVLANVQAFWEQYGAPAMAAIIAAGEAVVGWVKENWPQIKQTVSEVMTDIQVIIQGVVDFITMIWENFGEQIWSIIEGKLTAIKEVVQAAMEVIQGIIHTIASLIKGDWGEAWEGIKQIVFGVWDAIVATVTEMANTVKEIVSIAMEILGAAWNQAWEGIKSAVSGAWDGIKTLVSDGVNAVVGFVESIPGKVLTAAGTMWQPIIDAFTGAKDFVTDGIGEILGVVGNIPGNVKSALGSGFDAIWTSFKAVVNKVISGWNSISFPSFTIGGWDPPGPGPTIPGVTVGGWTVPQIPKLHTGGIVPGTPGSEVLALLQAGEQVIPRNEVGGGGGQVINVHMPVGSNGEDVVRTLKKYTRRNGPGWLNNL